MPHKGDYGGRKVAKKIKEIGKKAHAKVKRVAKKKFSTLNDILGQ